MRRVLFVDCNSCHYAFVVDKTRETVYRLGTESFYMANGHHFIYNAFPQNEDDAEEMISSFELSFVNEGVSVADDNFDRLISDASKMVWKDDQFIFDELVRLCRKDIEEMGHVWIE